MHVMAPLCACQPFTVCTSALASASTCCGDVYRLPMWPRRPLGRLPFPMGRPALLAVCAVLVLLLLLLLLLLALAAASRCSRPAMPCSPFVPLAAATPEETREALDRREADVTLSIEE